MAYRIQETNPKKVPVGMLMQMSTADVIGLEERQHSLYVLFLFLWMDRWIVWMDEWMDSNLFTLIPKR